MTVILSTEPNDAAIRYILYNKADIISFILIDGSTSGSDLPALLLTYLKANRNNNWDNI
jgi:hypothetical protein